MYITFWILITITAVVFVIANGFVASRYECSDGSVVTDAAECPQCFTDDECGPDLQCERQMCVAKDCLADADCSDPANACIYNRCMKYT